MILIELTKKDKNMLEDVKKSKKSQVTQKVIGMIGGGFPLTENYKVLSAQDLYLQNYWMVNDVDGCSVPFYDNNGNLTEIDFASQAEAKEFLNKIHDYICFCAMYAADLNKKIDTAETEEEINEINIDLPTFAEFAE